MFDIQKLKDKLNKVQGEGGKDFWKPPIGLSVIRILPRKNQTEDDFFFIEGKFHNVRTSEGTFSKRICPRAHFSKPCPFCEVVDKMRPTASQFEKEKVLPELYYRNRYFVNLLDIGKGDDVIYIWEFGKRIFEQLLTICTDEDVMDVSNPETGRELRLNRPSKMNPQYSLQPTMKSKPVEFDKSKLHDLSEQIRECSYEELEQFLNIKVTRIEHGQFDSDFNPTEKATDNSVGDTHEEEIEDRVDEKDEQTDDIISRLKQRASQRTSEK